jgi:5-methylcytosine-specific restriction endonuclease McrA
MKDNSSVIERISPYHSDRWRKFRRIVLNEEPLCAICLRCGQETLATVVDHIRPHRGDMELFWDRENVQGLCASCHSGVKRVKEHHEVSQACDINGFPIDAEHRWNNGR